MKEIVTEYEEVSLRVAFIYFIYSIFCANMSLCLLHHKRHSYRGDSLFVYANLFFVHTKFLLVGTGSRKFW